MPVSGLIVTLSNTKSRAEEALAWLESDARFELGDAASAEEGRRPLVVDTADSDADKQCWNELQEHPGIDFIDVVCVYFAESRIPSPPLT